MNWTAERDDLLRKLWAQKPFMSYTLIARAMGCFGHTKDGGRNAIGGRAYRLRLPKRGTETTRSAQQRRPGLKRGPYRPRPTTAKAPKPIKGPVRAGNIIIFGNYVEPTKSELRAMLREAVINTGGRVA